MPSELGNKANNRPNGRNSSGWKGFMRMLRLRLVIPLLRAKHEPEYTARGVFVGVALGLTPTVGIQIPMVMATWAAVRATVPAWNFNMIVAIAWVWLSNVFTLGPLYYGFLVTGRIMMGHHDALPGYQTFSVELMKALEVDADGLKGFWEQTVNLFDLYGVPMLIGCIPWALIWGWIGYVWTLKYLRRRQRLAAEKRAGRNPAPESAE
ncbi:MAG: DUF2062 domain-containing protein [Rhodospirillaceae bacterium]